MQNYMIIKNMFKPLISFLKTLVSKKARTLKRYRSLMIKINNRESFYHNQSEDQLKERCIWLKKNFNKEKEKEFLIEAFSMVREVSIRKLGMRHFDVQLIGGMVLYYGAIAEMGTGEGKTLVATLAVFMNYITGIKTHVVTVNDYLSQRDAHQLFPLYNFLGISIGIITEKSSQEERRAMYGRSVVYVCDHELGFDYLRDNIAKNKGEQTICGRLEAIIIDEIDNILIDNSRTPLIISGSGKKSSYKYKLISPLAATLQEKIDYEIDIDSKNSYLTEVGIEKIETLLQRNNIIKGSLFSLQNIDMVHYVNQSIKSHSCFKRNDDYLVQDDKIILIDKNTGRAKPGTRFGGGLHQGLEAKEGVTIRSESQTLATITYKNFVLLYKKISGMTGTASTEESEFSETYNLDVLTVPSNKLRIRNDLPDILFKDSKDRLVSLLNIVKEKHEKGQPVLIITLNIEDSEMVSLHLEKEEIDHFVLNARNHKKEAHIIEKGGEKGRVIVSTAMAGRGTDIVLGGNINNQKIRLLEESKESLIPQLEEENRRKKAEVIELGGLSVICMGRHETRRIDNQSIGRCGRQGEPGETICIPALTDELFSGLMKQGWTGRLLYEMVHEEGEKGLADISIDQNIRRMQDMNSARYFDIRKQQQDYDTVIDSQRKAIYEQRQLIVDASSIEDSINTIFKKVIEDYFIDVENESKISSNEKTPPLLEGSNKEKETITNGYKHISKEEKESIDLKSMFVIDDKEIIKNDFFNYVKKYSLESNEESQWLDMLTKVTLTVLDNMWRQYLEELSERKKGIFLFSFAQKEPLQIYKIQSLELFSRYINELKIEIVRQVTHTVFSPQEIEELDENDDNIDIMKEIESKDLTDAINFEEFLTKHLHEMNNPKLLVKELFSSYVNSDSKKSYGMDLNFEDSNGLTEDDKDSLNELIENNDIMILTFIENLKKYFHSFSVSQKVDIFSLLMSMSSILKECKRFCIEKGYSQNILKKMSKKEHQEIINEISKKFQKKTIKK
jgi:preprotein translocase subunit SecA